MATVRINNGTWAVVRDYSAPAAREEILEASREQVRTEERTVVRRLMRRSQTKKLG
jgi:hypothetical protein